MVAAHGEESALVLSPIDSSVSLGLKRHSKDYPQSAPANAGKILTDFYSGLHSRENPGPCPSPKGRCRAEIGRSGSAYVR